MANPTLVVEGFNGSLGSFSGVDPIRYDSGLWLEEAESNYVPNPVGATDVAGWSAQTDITMSHETSLPGPLPGWLAGLVTTGFRLTATANRSGNLAVSTQAAVDAAGAHRVAVYLWVPAAFSATQVGVRPTNFGGAGMSFTEVFADLSMRDQWQRLDGPFTVDAADLLGSILIRTTAGTMLAGEILWFTLAEIQPGSVLTSAVAETLGSGYANVGTAHNSASTRAASSASVTSAEPVSVACWYREGYSGAKQFAYLDTLGQLGDYGDVSWAAGDLTISTSRNLVIGPFAAFDRALTAGEQANLRSTQNWTMNSVNGSNIILPLSGARRRRR